MTATLASGVEAVGAIEDDRMAALAPWADAPWWRSGTPPVERATAPAPAPDPAGVRRVRQVLDAARLVCSWETDTGRGAFVVAGEHVVIDRIVDGWHDLHLADRASAVALLAIGLDPLDLARHRVSGPGPRVAAVDAAVAAAVDRRTTLRLVRLLVGPPARETVVTVVGGPAGLQAHRALPDGRVLVSDLDRDAVVGAAIALLDAEQPDDDVA